MKKQHSHQKKLPEQYNARDLLSYWDSLFEEYYKRDYQSSRLGQDMHILKSLLEENGVYNVLLGLERAIKNGVTSIQFLEDNFVRNYVPEMPSPKVYFYLRQLKDKATQKLYDEQVSIFHKSYRTAADAKRDDEINEQLNQWLEIVAV